MTLVERGTVLTRINWTGVLAGVIVPSGRAIGIVLRLAVSTRDAG